MRRLFGGSKKEEAPKGPPPNLADLNKNIQDRIGYYDQRIETLNQQLMQHKQQLTRLRPGTPAHKAAQNRALPLLRQRKMMEQQRDNLFNRLMHNESVQGSIEAMRDNVQMLDATRIAKDEMQKALGAKELDIDKIYDLQDEMEDMRDAMNEVQDAFGRLYDVPDEIDEGELMAELEGLEEEIALEKNAMPAYLQPQELPAMPAATPNPLAQPQAIQQ